MAGPRLPPAPRLSAHPDTAHVILAANDVEVSDGDMVIASSGALPAPIAVPGDGWLPRDGGNQ